MRKLLLAAALLSLHGRAVDSRPMQGRQGSLHYRV